ncbi:MAG TPA: hydroxymethylglutaryl-CoA lyase [Bryobacteraceae bacterium]|nr:hydroxymethylglutaryl-CoA lyase [Bryobacteraceae bacterium]
MNVESYPKRVRVVEVGPRDGLQNERAVSVETKVTLIESLVEAGVTTVECGSFVSAKRVPQMADTAAVLRKLRRKPGISYTVLVPNLRGLEAAVACGVEEIAVFASASESFSQSNIQSSIPGSLQRLGAVARQAGELKIRVRGYVSCVLGCPFEGDVPTAAVASVAKALLDMGCYEISLGDTIGVGTPLKTRAMLERVAHEAPMDRLAVHFHDTWGQALANVLIALQLGVAAVDASVAGLGGCPYAPGATGNLATEDLIYLLNGMGIETGIDLEKLAAAGRTISHALGREPVSRAAAAIAAKGRA